MEFGGNLGPEKLKRACFASNAREKRKTSQENERTKVNEKGSGGNLFVADTWQTHKKLASY